MLLASASSTVSVFSALFGLLRGGATGRSLAIDGARVPSGSGDLSMCCLLIMVLLGRRLGATVGLEANGGFGGGPGLLFLGGVFALLSTACCSNCFRMSFTLVAL